MGRKIVHPVAVEGNRPTRIIKSNYSKRPMKPSLYSIETCPIGSLFIMPKPSGEWLEEDIGHYKMQGITDVVSLLRSDEVAELNLTDEERYCRKVSIDFVRFPIQDRGLPDLN